MKEYYVFAGSFGSGKSELAINLAIRKAAENPPCTLVDMDVINPLGNFILIFVTLNIFMVINPPVRPWKSSKTPWSRAANCSSIVPSSIQRATAPTLTSITFRVMKLPTNWESTRSATWSCWGPIWKNVDRPDRQCTPGPVG